VVAASLSMSSLNAFQHLGIEAAFDINLKDLDRRYFALQAKAHPDRFSTHSDLDKQASITLASHLNQAYEILKNPVQRARCLLEIEGISVLDTTNSPEILEEALEWQEKLAEAKTPLDLDTLQNQIHKSLHECLHTLNQDFKEGRQTSCQQHYLRLVYLSKLKDDLKALQQPSTQGF